MNMFSAVLMSASVLGNGFVLASIAPFKSLRTVPNILVANLAVVDLLHVAVNLPFHMISNSEASWYRGQTLAIVTAFLNRVRVVLNLASMLAMMANVFLAIAFDFKYLAWKTKKKAIICVILIWLASLMVMILGCIPLLNINLARSRPWLQSRNLQTVKVFCRFVNWIFHRMWRSFGFSDNSRNKEEQKKVSIRLSHSFLVYYFLTSLFSFLKRFVAGHWTLSVFDLKAFWTYLFRCYGQYHVLDCE